MVQTVSPRVSTIPPGTPFVDSLALGLRERYGGAPDSLARLTLLLPTRRACLAMRDAFLRHSDGAALLLPRLMPLGDMDADEIEPGVGEGLPEGLAADEAEPVPAAISGLERQLILTRLIQARSLAEDAPRRPDQAARLAAELARLLDQAQTEQLPSLFRPLDGLPYIAVKLVIRLLLKRRENPIAHVANTNKRI